MSTLIYDLFNEIFKMGKWGVTHPTRTQENFTYNNKAKHKHKACKTRCNPKSP